MCFTFICVNSMFITSRSTSNYCYTSNILSCTSMVTHNQFLSSLTTLSLNWPTFVATRYLRVCNMRVKGLALRFYDSNLCVHTVTLKHSLVWVLKRLKPTNPWPWVVKTLNGLEVSELGWASCSPWNNLTSFLSL